MIVQKLISKHFENTGTSYVANAYALAQRIDMNAQAKRSTPKEAVRQQKLLLIFLPLGYLVFHRNMRRVRLDRFCYIWERNLPY